MLYKWIEAFVVAANYMNFSSAAESLNMTQSALSKQIQALEAHIGMRLFCRDARKRLTLTETGVEFLPEASSLLRHTIDVENMVKKRNLHRPDLTGSLKVGFDNKLIFADFQRMHLFPVANVFKSFYPQISVSFSFLNQQELHRGVKSGAIDIGIEN